MNSEALELQHALKKYGDPKKGPLAEMYLDALQASNPVKYQQMKDNGTLELTAILAAEQCKDRSLDLAESGTPPQIAKDQAIEEMLEEFKPLDREAIRAAQQEFVHAMPDVLKALTARLARGREREIRFSPPLSALARLSVSPARQ